MKPKPILSDRQIDRQKSIDIIKGICILFIIITHYSWSDSERLRLLFPFWVDMAVPIFMIISGYVNANSFRKKNITSLLKSYNKQYVFKRLIRYTSPFIIAFCIEIFAIIIKSEFNYSLIEIIYLYLQGGIGPGSYYYPVLLQFIVVFPIIYHIIRIYDYKGLFYCFIINVSYEILKSAYMMNEECYRLLIFRYVFLIAFGCYFAIGKTHIKNLYFVFAILFSIIYIIIVKYFYVTPVITNYWSGTSIFAIFIVLPVVFLFNKKIYFKPIEILGKSSYHIFLTQMVYYCSVELIYSVIPNKYIQLLINIIICTLLGIVFYYFETFFSSFILRHIIDNKSNYYK